MLYYGKKSNKGKGQSKAMTHRRNPASDIGKVLGIALLGGAAADAVNYLMGKIGVPTTASPGLKMWQRGAIQIGVGAVAGGLLATKYPQVAVAVAAGNIALGGQYLVLEAQTYMNSCPTGQVRNAQNACAAAAPPTCTAPQQLNAARTACETPACPPGQARATTAPFACGPAGAGGFQRRYPAYVNR